MDEQLQDMCRVCRSEATPDRPLFHPCICTGSIKYIHQECLVQWLRYSRKEYCELCNHRFSFTPIYDPDMPKRVPLRDIVAGLVGSVVMAVRCWFHYTLVGLAWLGIVPLFAYRIYRSLFTGSVSSIFTLPLDLLTTENILADILQGCVVVTCTLCAFISLVWLREQILHGGGPDWLENENGAGGDNVPEVGDQGDDAVFVEDNDAPNAPAAVPAPPPEENNWNPIEWDRAAEELTWERLLGLDGSLMFLEHVVWVVSLNTLFILVFAFCPYHIGHFTIAGFGFRDSVSATRFEGLVTTLSGYCVIAAGLVCLHAVATLWGARAQKWQRMLGLCYVVVKVSLLAVVEVGLFPLLCGWWLDMCSLHLFHATLKDREESFMYAPGTSMFLHWLAGMVYVFYFANFILLLREVLRPGVLWFLRNLNDPDFNPIQEMIHLSLWRHLRRFVASLVIFGSTILLMLWVPVQCIRKLWPSFLPYTLVLTSEVPASELSLELLLLQVVLPALLEQGHTREWLKTLIRGWCVGVSSLLSLHSYLLPDSTMEARPPPVNADNGGGGGGGGGDAAEDGEEEDVHEQQIVWGAPGGLGAAHQALLQHREGGTEFQPYRRPSAFPLRISILLVLMSVTVSMCSFVALTIPVYVGRWLLGLWLVGSEGGGRLHELYTGSCGLYICWAFLRGLTLLVASLPQGWRNLLRKVRHWAVMAGKLFVAVFLLTGVVPLLYGLLLELVVVIPLRVPLTQSPLHFLWQDWALGVLYTKITCALTMMGPQWWLKQAIEQVYQDGMRNLRMKGIVRDLAMPVIGTLGLALTVPYVIAYSLTPLFVPNKEIQLIVCRRIYPSLLLAVIIVGLLGFQIVQFARLYEHIKNDKYLVGRRLVNYNHRDSRDVQQQPVTAPPSPSSS